MEFRQLKTFVNIAKLGSFAQAAEKLGYAQSTITNQIQTLENEVGVKLFERLGHRIMLTHHGKSLLLYAEQIIHLTSEALEAVSNTDTPQGKLIIGTSESLGTYRLPELLSDYRRTYPKVDMIIKYDNCSTICDYLRTNQIDIGFTIDNRKYEDDLLVYHISKEQMLFLVSPDHPLSKKEKVTPNDLSDTGIIYTEPGCSYRQTMEEVLSNFKISLQSVLEASSIESIKQLIMLGLGISMLPHFTVEKELADSRLCAVAWEGPNPDYYMRMLHHKDKWISPTIQAFLKMAGEFLGKNS